MSQIKGGLMYVFALTTLHPGVGRAGVHVDLPIQRDEFDYPVIWATGLKGSLRSYFTRLDKRDEVRIVFGPEPASDEVSEYSSAISVHDARLILLPARSLRGVWIYTTSPHLLSYLDIALEALEAQGQEVTESIQEMRNSLGELKAISTEKDMAILSDNKYLVDDSHVFINEKELTAKVDIQLINKIRSLIPAGLRDKVHAVALLNDEDMREIVKKSLLVQYRVRLRETKTVEPGALWSEEHIPQRTIFVSYVACWPPKGRSAPEDLKTPDSIYWFIKQAHFINLGGKETVGHGLVRLEWLP